MVPHETTPGGSIGRHPRRCISRPGGGSPARVGAVSIDLSESFKAYDVRGIVGETITAETVEATAAAFVDVQDLAGTTVLVGGDMRPSSPEFMDAFARGATARGADVVKIGLISTDELYFACGVFDAPGVTFTASHNPAQYNGMKMAKAGAVPVSSETGLYEIRDLAQRYLDDGVPAGERTGTVEERDILADYARYLRDLVDLSGIRKLKVVVDAGNGMGGMTTPAVLGDAKLEALPLEIVPLYFELDGTFPNHEANPLDPKNLVDLQERKRDLFATGRYPAGTIPVWSVDRNGRVDFSRPIRRLSETEALALLRPIPNPPSIPMSPAPSTAPADPAPVQAAASLTTRILAFLKTLIGA